MKNFLHQTGLFLIVTFMLSFSATAESVLSKETINKLTPITLNLKDESGLDSSVATVWVCGWINGGVDSFQVLQEDGTFGGSSPTSVPYYKLSSLPQVTLSTTTNGNDRLQFVVSLSQPDSMQVATSSPKGYTQYPYSDTPGIAAPGPFDILEFGYNAAFNISSVSGYGLNLQFTIENTNEKYGTVLSHTRKEIGEAYTKFITNEALSLPSAANFAELLYDAPISASAPTPPSVGNQFFAICDPNDMLAAKTSNYSASTTDPLATYWDATLSSFFTVGKYLSINISGGTANIYSGQCSLQTNPKTGIQSPAYVLTQTNTPNNTYTFYMPPAGLKSAQYVFQQAFGDLTPEGSSGDAGIIQDNIWESLCRGVALDGVSDTQITNGESTTSWNNFANWYQAGKVCHYYAKFLHYSTIDGTDSRTSGTSILLGHSAYGFSLDENPDGPYSGDQVPSKTLNNIPGGSTITVTVGPYENSKSTYSISGTISGDVKKGVTIKLSDGSTGTATTDANGDYTFVKLSNNTYTITPSLTGYIFSPSSSSVTIAGANQSGQDFTAIAVVPRTYSISGTLSGDTVEDVKISLSGIATSTTTTGADGTYSFANLMNGDYTVTPSLSGHSFEPTSSSITISGADVTGQDFTSTGGKLAPGMVFTVDANDIQGLPTTGKFMKKPKVYTKYTLSDKEKKSNAKVLTKLDKDTGASSVDCEWTKKILLYNKKSFKEAQKQGTSAATWVADSTNQQSLHMDLRLASKEVEDQSVQPIALSLPVINDISAGEQDAKGNDTLVISGQWFGIKNLKISREFVVDGGTAIKQQKMKVIKPSDADAAAGYVNSKGKPAFMNSQTGASKVVVIIPSKLPKGILNGTIVLNNNTGMATGTDPSN